MKRKIAILQSNYIPWLGYFDLINYVDCFVIYDIVQYTKNDWRNRNRILVNGQPSWLTIPVIQESLQQKINETRVVSHKWVDKHWRTVSQNYASQDGYNTYCDQIQYLYEASRESTRLSEINLRFIEGICDLLNIDTKIYLADAFELPDDREDRLISLCQQIGANTYVSGPAAQSYIHTEKFSAANIQLEWFNYEGFAQYQQKTPNFIPNLSILDLLFSIGKDAVSYLRYNNI